MARMRPMVVMPTFKASLVEMWGGPPRVSSEARASNQAAVRPRAAPTAVPTSIVFSRQFSACVGTAGGQVAVALFKSFVERVVLVVVISVVYFASAEGVLHFFSHRAGVGAVTTELNKWFGNSARPAFNLGPGP